MSLFSTGLYICDWRLGACKVYPTRGILGCQPLVNVEESSWYVLAEGSLFRVVAGHWGGGRGM